jgi:eukaryotic-like serine/threonine-protein kinase
LPEVLAGGRYRLVRSLAKGGMGEVLLAEFPGDTTLAITPGYVVLKRVLPDAHNRPHQVRMLREEGRISLRLLHENLVESFFVDEHEGDPILVMEFLAGRSVAQLLGLAKKNKDMLPIDATLALMRASACGLHFAHTLTDRGGGAFHEAHGDRRAAAHARALLRVLEAGLHVVGESRR